MEHLSPFLEGPHQPIVLLKEDKWNQNCGEHQHKPNQPSIINATLNIDQKFYERTPMSHITSFSFPQIKRLNSLPEVTVLD